MRQILSGLPGARSQEGRDLVLTIVGGGSESGAKKVDLTHYLSPFQVQELVLMEREAAINELGASC